MSELTVKEALVWSDKHRKLKGEGARVVHIKQLLSTQKKEIGELRVTTLGNTKVKDIEGFEET